MVDLTTYLNRITSQHKTKPRFMALVAARLSILADLYNCLQTLDAAFDLDLAVGQQLDAIGGFVGVKRLLTFQSKYESPLLSDEYYRILIRAKIFMNQWDGTMEGIYEIWHNIFPHYTLGVIDNQDMSMKVVVQYVRTAFEKELIQHGYIIPKPMGVLVNYDALLSWVVEGMLYGGGYQVLRTARWTVGFRPPPDEIDGQYGNAYIGGVVALKQHRFRIPSYEAPSVPPQAAILYVAGAVVSNHVKYKIPSGN